MDHESTSSDDETLKQWLDEQKWAFLLDDQEALQIANDELRNLLEVRRNQGITIPTAEDHTKKPPKNEQDALELLGMGLRTHDKNAIELAMQFFKEAQEQPNRPQSDS